MIRIDTVRVDKAESKEDLYLMSLRVSANTAGLKDLSNALDNVLYIIEHSEALLSEPVGLIDDEEDNLSVLGLGKGKLVKDEKDITSRRNGRIDHNAELETTKGEILRFAKLGDTIQGPVRITCMDPDGGDFSYIEEPVANLTLGPNDE